MGVQTISFFSGRKSDCIHRRTHSVVSGVCLARANDGSKETTDVLQHSPVKSSHNLDPQWTAFDEYSHHII